MTSTACSKESEPCSMLNIASIRDSILQKIETVESTSVLHPRPFNGQSQNDQETIDTEVLLAESTKELTGDHAASFKEVENELVIKVRETFYAEESTAETEISERVEKERSVKRISAEWNTTEINKSCNEDILVDNSAENDKTNEPVKSLESNELYHCVEGTGQDKQDQHYCGRNERTEQNAQIPPSAEQLENISQQFDPNHTEIVGVTDSNAEVDMEIRDKMLIHSTTSDTADGHTKGSHDSLLNSECRLKGDAESSFHNIVIKSEKPDDGYNLHLHNPSSFHKEFLQQSSDIAHNQVNGVAAKEGIADNKDDVIFVGESYRSPYSDSDSNSDNDTSTISSFEDVVAEQFEGNENVVGPRTKGEIYPDELPPLQDLQISLQESTKLVQIGVVTGIVDVLVVIKSTVKFGDQVLPVNDDTVLFFENRKPFGKVFEVFGTTVLPYYSVRFNSSSEIADKGIEIGLPVFFAPDPAPCEADITHFIFVNKLSKLKGSDASWEDNNEPPPGMIEYSDDEEEKRAKAKRKAETRKSKPDGAETNKRAESNRGKNRRKGKSVETSKDGEGSEGSNKDATDSFRMQPWSAYSRQSYPSGSSLSSSFKQRPYRPVLRGRRRDDPGQHFRFTAPTFSSPTKGTQPFPSQANQKTHAANETNTAGPRFSQWGSASNTSHTPASSISGTFLRAGAPAAQFVRPPPVRFSMFASSVSGQQNPTPGQSSQCGSSPDLMRPFPAPFTLPPAAASGVQCPIFSQGSSSAGGTAPLPVSLPNQCGNSTNALQSAAFHFGRSSFSTPPPPPHLNVWDSSPTQLHHSGSSTSTAQLAGHFKPDVSSVSGLQTPLPQWGSAVRTAQPSFPNFHKSSPFASGVNSSPSQHQPFVSSINGNQTLRSSDTISPLRINDTIVDLSKPPPSHINQNVSAVSGTQPSPAQVSKWGLPADGPQSALPHFNSWGSSSTRTPPPQFNPWGSSTGGLHGPQPQFDQWNDPSSSQNVFGIKTWPRNPQ